MNFNCSYSLKKNLQNKNIANVVHDGLCNGCGVCQDVCEQGCISINRNKDVNVPVLDNQRCNGCGMCRQVCSGLGNKLKEVGSSLFVSDKCSYDSNIGFFHKCFATYSCDLDIRYHASAGGTITQLLCHLLDTGFIDGAAIVGYGMKDIMSPFHLIARNTDQIQSCRGVKLCPVSQEGIAREILEHEGKYIIVGLPCHIQSFRKLAMIDHVFSERVVGYWGLQCAGCLTFRSQRYFQYRYQPRMDLAKYFFYSDEGFPGYTYVRDENGVRLKVVQLENHIAGMKGVFDSPRCGLCDDHYAQLADVTFGALTLPPYTNNHIGWTSVIVRNPYWIGIIGRAVGAKVLNKWDIAIQTIKDSQSNIKSFRGEHHVGIARMVRKLTFRSNPVTDQVYPNPSVADCWKYLSYNARRFVFKPRFMWHILKSLDKGNHTYWKNGDIRFVGWDASKKIIDSPEIKKMNRLSSSTNKITDKEKYEIVRDYLLFVRDYCVKELDGKAFDIPYMVPRLYNQTSLNQQMFECVLFALKEYVEEFIKVLSKENIGRYNDIIHILRNDVDEVMLCNEEQIKRGISGAIKNTMSPWFASPEKLLECSFSHLFAEEYNPSKGLCTGAMHTTMLFNIRQTLELVGKGIIGFTFVKDAAGSPSHKFSQVAWDFLLDYDTRFSGDILLNVPINCVSAISKWANRFIHTGFMEPLYMQYYAYYVVETLMRPPKTSFVNRDGTRHSALDFGDYRLKNYDRIKSEFEKYCKSKLSTCSIEWSDEKYVQAHIIS